MYPWVLSADLMTGLKALSQQEGVTLFQTLLAGFAVLLQRYSGQDDIPIGSVTSGRDVPGTELLLGYFLNTLVLRLDLSGNPTFRELLVRARNVTLEALAHDKVPLTQLISELRIRRDSSRTPLFQSMFTLEPPIPPLDSGWQLTQMDIDTGATKYDLYLELDERRNGILARFHYNTDLFDASTVVRMAEQWTTVLEAAVANPAAQVRELPVLPPSQRQQLLVNWNATDASSLKGTIHSLFEREVQQSPNAVAIQFENQWLTYADLNACANRLARYLQHLGAGPNVLIGVSLERSIQMVVALLGILKTGAAYIPLDPQYPEERLRFVLSDANPLLCVTQESLRERFAELQTVTIDSDWPHISQESGDNLDNSATPEDLAYVIYTSGSTGKPKGVQVEHRSVVSFLSSMQREPGITPQDVLAAVTTISFDIAGLEIYLPLVSGARIALVPTEVSRDGGELNQLLDACGATIMQATPATWRLLLEAGWQGSRDLKVLCGGEPLNAALAEEIAKRCSSLWNLYGPTETTIWSLVQRVSACASNTVPIGKPIENTKVYILDDRFNPVPIGVAGEICIGGHGVARGYLKQPELTAERFIPNPFEPGSRVYRTGDMGRYRSDGSVEFLGRNDTQVKIRGFRVELGEIETALLKHDGVKAAVAAVRDFAPGDPRLVAYVVSADRKKADAGRFREYLRPVLPDYMIPAHFVFLDELPLTPNGKVNRKALPAPDASLVRKTEVVPAADQTEAQLVQIWETILNTRPIGVTDDFFEVGGHSILAVRLFAEIEKVFGKTIPLAALLKAPTIAQLAKLVRDDAKPNRWTSLVPVQTSGAQPPIFCVHGHYGEILFYRPLARHLGNERPFFALQAVATNGRPAHETIEEMAAHYIAEMRQARPHGPYYIAGYCFGSLVAFEMAQRLVQDGEQVAFLGLFMGYEPRQTFGPRLNRRIRRHVEQLRRDGLQAKLSDVLLNLKAKSRSFVWRTMFKTCRGYLPATSRFFRNIPEMNLQAAKRYFPQYYPGKMTVFLSGDVPTNFVVDPQLDLHGLNAAEIEVRVVPGNQHTMMEEPHAAVLAVELDRCLQSKAA
jgi:amino acid adenylation domain-containing protein